MKASNASHNQRFWYQRTAVFLALLVILLALVAVACGGGDEETSGGPEGSTPTGGSEPRSGSGELRLASDDPPTLDPHLATDATSATYIVEIFGGLVTIDKDLKIVPDLAERWDVSPDGTVYTFYLRSNALFHSGKRVTANDIKCSMERAADPRTLSPVADTYLGDIVGVKDKLRGRTQDVRGVEVVDESTVRITIDAAKPYFLAKLTYPTAFVIDCQQVQQNPARWSQRPNGTGPYRLQSWRPGESITLVANPRYHLDPKPSIQKVTYLLAGGSPLTMYENGEIDITGVGLSDIERVRDPRDPLNKEFREVFDLDVSYIGFNIQQQPFDDVKVRQAFAMSIDKQKLAEVALRNAVTPAKGILPPGMPGYNPDLKGLEYNPERAKQLLRESKYGERLPRVTMTVVGAGATSGPTTDAILEMWRQNLGVQVEVQQVEFVTFLQDQRRGRFQMFEAGWIADYVDPEDFLDILFHSQSLDNSTKYNNPQVDQLLESARTEKDANKRMDLYRRAEEIVVNEAPWIPLFHGKSNVLIKPYVKGWVVAPLVIPHLRYASIER